MKIKVPDGKIYDLEECVIFEEYPDQQSILADELFKQAGILVADKKGGDD